MLFRSDEQRANRFLNVSHTSGGALVKGRLDSVAGYKLQKVLDAPPVEEWGPEDADWAAKAKDRLAKIPAR